MSFDVKEGVTLLISSTYSFFVKEVFVKEVCKSNFKV